MEIIANLNKPASGRGKKPRYDFSGLKPGETAVVPFEDRVLARSLMRYEASQVRPHQLRTTQAWTWESWTGPHPTNKDQKVCFIKRLT